MCGSLPVAGDPSSRPVNRFLCAFPDGRTVGYDKVHPFSYGGEDKHYAAGSSVSTFHWEGTALTPFVCYDLRFADLFWATGHVDRLLPGRGQLALIATEPLPGFGGSAGNRKPGLRTGH